jgi:hypothetical protein
MAMDTGCVSVLAPASLQTRATQPVWRMPVRTTSGTVFASLLLHEGRSVIYVARQLGHDARLTLTRMGT